jgi:dienelactone hydrolase
MRSRRAGLLAGAILLLLALAWVVPPYARATSLIVRAAHLGGSVEAFAKANAHPVTRQPKQMLPTRHGEVPAQFYLPDGRSTRTVMLIPGIHSMGIDEPRLISLASELAASGVTVMTLALPDLEHYRITPDSSDVIEDAVLWLTSQPLLAPDGKIGLIGVSFAGGLSVAAAGRPAIRDKLAFVLSFGGHADLPRVMRYLATGVETAVPGVSIHPPHDYGVAVILYGLADRGVVPADQVKPLRHGIEAFLLASQQAAVDKAESEAGFARARLYAKTLPEPARTYMGYVNDRAVNKLGPVLVPFLDQLGADDPMLSADRAAAPAAPVYLLHGREDTVIPAAESALLAEHLENEGADVHLLLTDVVTHADVNHGAAVSEAWNLVSFWARALGE